MGGSANSRLHEAAYVIRLYNQVKDKALVQEAKQYVRSAINDVGTVESFKRISQSLALDTNIGRLVVICAYAEELKTFLPEKTVEIDQIRDQCLEIGMLDRLLKGDTSYLK